MIPGVENRHEKFDKSESDGQWITALEDEPAIASHFEYLSWIAALAGNEKKKNAVWGLTQFSYQEYSKVSLQFQPILSRPPNLACA